MFKKNQQHLQAALISNINELPEKLRQRLDSSWAGVFRREFFMRIQEEPFAVLFSDLPSRPNTPVNVLVGLETLKAGLAGATKNSMIIFATMSKYVMHWAMINLVKGTSNCGRCTTFVGD